MFVIGFVVLLRSADLLVVGASSLAKSLKISPLIIGLTIVAFGTSSPELIVSLIAAIRGSTDLIFGNIVGSNIFNIGVIMALASIINPLRIRTKTVWREIPISLLGSIVFLFLSYDSLNLIKKIRDFAKPELNFGYINQTDGVILLIFFIIFLYYSFIETKTGNSQEMTDLPVDQLRNRLTSGLFIFLGLVGLIISSNLVVDNGVYLARFLGISEKVIGLTLIAAGTSLPELVTSLVASYKKESDISVGNIIGSNVFNIFFILAFSSLISPIKVTSESFIDILVMIIFTFFTFVSFFIFHKKYFDRFEGIICFGFYLVYIYFLFF